MIHLGQNSHVDKFSLGTIQHLPSIMNREHIKGLRSNEKRLLNGESPLSPETMD